ncbi:MAG: choice-of-anchor L domain-containing protein [Labilithrix sp.]|nr:choice-of-anchor L domain-containing protein [Labilithrix sp.]
MALLAIACSSASQRSGFATDKAPTEPGQGPGGIGGDSQVGDSIPTSECGINNTGDGDPEADYDGDGYPLKNDCNECNKTINKGARDIPGNGIDEDCSGTPDDEPESCDGATEIGDGYEAAAAMGLCKKSDGVSWGIINAKLVKPDGKKLTKLDGVGAASTFGTNKPREGSSLFVLSTGKAATFTAGGGGGLGGLVPPPSHGTPDGYPKESSSCTDVPDSPPSTKAYDGAALEVKIRVPSNAKSFSYQHFFLTEEFPRYVCSKYNDFFVTMMSPIPAGLPDGNIAFDSENNPIGVNSGLFRACKPGTYRIGDNGAGTQADREFACEDGVAALKGTGLDKNKPTGDPGGGGTGWLTTTAPVTPGEEITLLFAVWDSGDGALDTTVLIDDFKFSLEDSGTTATAPTDVK